MSRSAQSFRKITAVVACALLVMPGPGAVGGNASAQSGDQACVALGARYYCAPQTEPPPPVERAVASRGTSDGPQRTTGDDSGSEPQWNTGSNGGAVIALAVVGVAVLAAVLLGGSDAGKLKKEGPRFVDTYPIGSFAIRGFARDGWPVVLDYRPRPNTVTTLAVVFGEDKVASVVVDPDGLGGRSLIKIETPSLGWAKKEKPADYVVRSVYRPGTSMAGQAAPLDVYGIGGGPRAVGSVAVEKLLFRPVPGDPAAPVAFQYNAKSPFNRVRSEVVRFDNDGSQIRLTRVMQADARDTAVGLHSGTWSGLADKSHERSVGAHRFQVRAWFTSDDKSWVGAVAPTLLTVN